MRRITIRLLGPFEVIGDGAPLTGFAYTKVRALLAYLAVEAAQPHTRASLATLLWPDQPEQSARGSLSQALTTLRSALGDKQADAPALLADIQHVWLNPSIAIDVDVISFRAALAEAEAHPHRSWRTCAACAESLRQALELYRGAFLADIAIPDSAVFEEWAMFQRERLLQRALSGLERLVERAQWRGAYPEALGYAQRLVALDPLLEGGQRSLMRLLALNGETAAALVCYRQLQALLAQELGAEPEAATTALFEQIRRSDLAAIQPQTPPFTVPLAPTPLVGRADELRSLCAQLRTSGGQAITITGTGGIGKTRLALAAAHELRFDVEDGIVLVELAGLNDAAQVADAIARALGVKERPQQALRETLGEILSAKHLLLILDNFEHVVEAAPLVSELLAACPALIVLVTSRAPLLIRAERLMILEPLSEAEAVQLFLQRTQAAGADLPTDAASAGIYAAICRRLDRLPLAIELIAVRARTLAPHDLLRQLEQPLHALARGPRDLSTRHQSLRHAIQWSYDLLDAEEQRVFRSLGVFAGGCTAEAAQVVVGQAAAALPILETLTQASLLQRQIVADQARLLILETIREFALEQLTLHDEAEAARRRHAEHFGSFAMNAYIELLRPEAARWRAWVAAEYDNLRAAFRWAMENQLHEAALRIATGIWRFHLMAGNLREALDRLESALGYRERATLEIQCAALRAAGTVATALNDYPRARRWLELAVEAGWRLGDQESIQPVLTNLGYALLEQGELEDALVHLEVSLSLARRSNDPTFAKFPLGMLASLHRRLGNYAQARPLIEECLRINRERRDPEGTADALVTLGTIVLAQGDPGRAHELGEEAMEQHRALGHQLGMGRDLALLGDVARARGEHTAALARYQQCLSLWRERGNSVTGAFVLDSVALTLIRLGDPSGGATLLGASGAIREQAGARLTAPERASCDATSAECRAALGEATFAAAWATGRAMTMAQAIDLVLAR